MAGRTCGCNSTGEGPNVIGPGGFMRSILLFCVWLAGVVRLPGGDPGVGSNVDDVDRVPRCHCAPLRWSADLRVDRQSAHGQHRSRRRYGGIPSADRRNSPPLGHGGAHLCALRPRVEGWQRRNRQDRQSRSGAHRCEPAGLHLVRGCSAPRYGCALPARSWWSPPTSMHCPMPGTGSKTEGV